MKTRSDQNRIIAGSILMAVCIALCAVGIWGCVYSVQSGRKDAAREEAVLQGGVQNNETEAGEDISPDSLTQTMDGILAWQCAEHTVSNVQELLDTAYAGRAVNGTVQTYVIGLYGYQPDYDYTGYALGVQNALREDQISAMSLQKSTMVLSALQADNPVPVAVLEETIGQQGIMSELFGLLMLDGMAAEDGIWTREALVQEILSKQLPDGGFAITGTEGDVDVTAMALQALAPYYRDVQDGAEREKEAQGIQGAMEHENDAQVVQTVEHALVFLSEKQLATGDFESGGTPNAESTAQVVLALCALGRDVWTDELFIKTDVTLLDGLSRYRNADGGFSHTMAAASNDMASSQVFAALSALNRSMQTTLKEEIPSDSRKDSGGGKSGMDMRMTLMIWILAGDCGYLAYLCLIKKYSRKRLYGVVLVTTVLAAALWLVRIQSKDAYLRQDSGSDEEHSITVSMEIRCDTVAGAEEYLPADGVILAKTTVSAGGEDSAFDVLRETARAYEIPIEYEGTAAGDEFAYIEGIAYLYEYDYGELSGWIFLVNGETPNVGCGAYRLADGDEIIWYYTKELGRDVSAELLSTEPE